MGQWLNLQRRIIKSFANSDEHTAIIGGSMVVHMGDVRPIKVIAGNQIFMNHDDTHIYRGVSSHKFR